MRHIENEAAYNAAIRRRMIRNGVKGRLDRLDAEAPMIRRLIDEVINPAHRRRHERHEAKRQADTERLGFTWHPAGTDPEDVDWQDAIAHEWTPLFELGDRTDATAAWVASVDWSEVEHYSFPEQLALQYLKRSKGLSAKQMAWVEKLVAEEPRKEAAAAERQAEREAANAASQHVGNVGNRVRDMEVTVDFVKTIDGTYGQKRIVKMRDPNGNLFVTFATSDWVWDAVKGARYLLTGTIKAHDDYQGAKQTVLTRTKGIPYEDM